MVLHPQYDCTDQGQPRSSLTEHRRNMHSGVPCWMVPHLFQGNRVIRVPVRVLCNPLPEQSFSSLPKTGCCLGYLICGARNKHRASLLTPCYVPFRSLSYLPLSMKLPPTLTASKWRGEGEAFQDSLSWSFIRIWISSWRALVSLFRDPSRRGQGPVSHR